MIKDPERISVKTVAGHHRLQAGTRQVNKGEGERQNIQLTGHFRSKGVLPAEAGQVLLRFLLQVTFTTFDQQF